MNRAIFCILLSVAIFAPIARRIYAKNEVSPAQLAAAQAGVVDPASISPEPAERKTFIIGCLLVLPLTALLMQLFGFLEAHPNMLGLRGKLFAWVAAGLVLAGYVIWLTPGVLDVPFTLCLAVGLAYLLHLSGCWIESSDAGARRVFAALASAYGVSAKLRISPARRRFILESAAIVAWLALVAWAVWSNDPSFFPLLTNLCFQHWWWIVPVVLVAVPALVWLNNSALAGRAVALVIGGSVLCAAFLLSWIDEHNGYTKQLHFAAIFDSVAQVQMGKNTLENYDSQYGLYPDLLAPWFSAIGLSVTKFSFTMALLTTASFSLLWWVISQSVSRRGLAVLGFVALVFSGWLMHQLSVRSFQSAYFDLYYQYMPLRVIFPASAVALCWASQRSASRRLYWLSILWLSIGVLWNLDGGLVALAAWMAAVGYNHLFEAGHLRRGVLLVRHVLATSVGLVGVVATFLLIKRLYFGHTPHLGRLFSFQRIFYLRGFYMLPMQLQGIWLLVVLIYVVGLVQSVLALQRRDRTPRQTLTLMLSVLGLGLFSYYQGRTHNYTLILCWWPAFLLLPIYLDQLLDACWQGERRRPLAFALAATIAFFLLDSAATFASRVPDLVDFVIAPQLAPSFAADYQDDVQMLRAQIPAGQEALFLGVMAPQLHFESGVRTLASAGLQQMLLVKQYEDLLLRMQQQDNCWVFIERDFESQYFLSPAQNLGTHRLMDLMTGRLEKVAAAPHGSLYRFQGRGFRVAASASPAKN